VSEAPVWIDKRALLMLHSESLAQFSGAVGLRDEGLLDSALARPVNKHTYEGCNDPALLAAAYGYGLARNHPFVDGNKRAAFLAVGVFSRDERTSPDGIADRCDRSSAGAGCGKPGRGAVRRLDQEEHFPPIGQEIVAPSLSLAGRVVRL
jgi:hypothetical protein